MRRICAAMAAVLLAGCGAGPSEVFDGGPAPTGVAPGVTLYFLDERGELTPDRRDTGRLGSISEAMALLLTGPGGSGLHTGIAEGSVERMMVTVKPGLVDLVTPLEIGEVTPAGIDQIVCTALGVHVQSGGSTDTRVRVGFVQPTPESEELRTCPLIG
ncbi:hypothetical protein [Nocardiopsis potens]|uniref:hypothetical protein n=1 Tax=Nocardiopsis potens TaxID=1246458 RepID=UPI00034B10B4|nr:hypothetical protein [Nocardiopsis potens]